MRYKFDGSSEVMTTTINTKVKYTHTYTHTSTQNTKTLSNLSYISDLALVFSSLPVTYSHAGGA